VPLNEAETRSQLINPAIQLRGWRFPLVREEVTAKKVVIEDDGTPTLVKAGKADYVLLVQVNRDTEPVPVAVLEAKSEDKAPDHGLEQAKAYATCERLHVPVVISSNGHQFVLLNTHTGITASPAPMPDFPTPAALRDLYEAAVGFSLDAPEARPLLTPYKPDAGAPRYYQDAAVRAVLEQVARCRQQGREPRALLSLATGAGKTFIACNLLRRIADAGQLRRALFVCDRTELRTQALAAMQRVFGSDAAVVEEGSSGVNKAANARVHIATFQTLDVDKEDGTANFLTMHYPPDYFSHIVIDEAHRSAWGKWSAVLTRNPNAVKIGLTATPRELKVNEDNPEAQQDAAITANNIAYFGEPVYEYTMAQAMDDGYLAACEIVTADVSIDRDGLTIDQVMALNPKDARTGQPLTREQIEQQYFAANTFEKKLHLPDRVARMCGDLFEQLITRDGDPHQKTIIFCASDDHAAAVAAEMGNIYARWCLDHQVPPRPDYAFKCTAAANGNAQLPDFKGAVGSHYIATTVDLLTTGVDVPVCRNIVFFRYLNSPISFYQMVGRGTRLDLPTGKLLFRIYDYTNATRLFGEDFITKAPRSGRSAPRPPSRPRTIIRVDGISAVITPGQDQVLINLDGDARPVSIDDFKDRLTTSLLRQVPTIAGFRAAWCDRSDRAELLYHLPGGHKAALVLRELEFNELYDLYDVLARIGYETQPLTRPMRAGQFNFLNASWFAAMPSQAREVVSGLANQFALGGTDALEDPSVFQTPLIVRAGGLPALRSLGEPRAVLRETKERLFAV
jgi:type I restriction enzyme R subunit